MVMRWWVGLSLVLLGCMGLMFYAEDEYITNNMAQGSDMEATQQYHDGHQHDHSATMDHSAAMDHSKMDHHSAAVDHSKMDHHSATMDHHSETAHHDCVQACANGDLCRRDCRFENVEKWVNDICTTKPWLSGCYLKKQVCGTQVGAPCSPLSIAGSICLVDSLTKTDEFCQSYAKVCTKNALINECSENPPFIDLVPSEAATLAVIRMCEMMPMSGCEKCVALTDCREPLSTLVGLCKDMRMPGCELIDATCQALDHTEFKDLVAPSFGCSTLDTTPVMRMYFHYGIHDYVLFESFVPKEKWEYRLTCLFITLTGLFSAYLKGVRHHIQQTWNENPIVIDEKLYGTGPLGILPVLWHHSRDERVILLVTRNTTRMILTMIITTIDYFLMLIAMTFNIGFFISVILAFGLGQFVFSHWTNGDVKKIHNF